MQKYWSTVLNVKVTARAYIIKIYLLYYISKTAGSFATKLALIVQHYKPLSLSIISDYHVEKNWLLVT